MNENFDYNDLETLTALVTIDGEDESVSLKLSPRDRFFELEVGNFYLELWPSSNNDYCCFHFDECDIFEVVSKTRWSNLALNDSIRFKFAEKAEGMKFLMRLSTAGILKPLCAEYEENVYEDLNYAELEELHKPKVKSMQKALDKVWKLFPKKPKERPKSRLEDSAIYESIDDERFLHQGSEGALSRSPSSSSGQPTPPAIYYGGSQSLPRNLAKNVNYSRPKRRPPAPPKDHSVEIDNSALEAIKNYEYVTLSHVVLNQHNQSEPSKPEETSTGSLAYYTKEDISLPVSDDGAKSQTKMNKSFPSASYSAEYQVPSRLRPPISKLETPIAPKLASDPDRVRPHSPVEESMSVKDRISRMNLNETANRESQLSPLSSRRHFQPRKTPIPPKPVISSPKRTTCPVANPATYLAVSNQVQNTSQRLDKEENSSSGKVSVQGLAKRFSSPIDNAPKQEDSRVLPQKPIPFKTEIKPSPSRPGRVTNAQKSSFSLPTHENGNAMTLMERIEKLQSQSQPK